MPLANPLAPLLGSIYGSLYFSTIMSTGFYGVACMQTFFYYIHYQADPLRLKCFVVVVWAFNTIHEALTVAGTYKYFMAELGNRMAVLYGVPELVILFTSLVAVATQGFFVHRIYIFNGRNIVVPLIWVPLGIYELVATFIYVKSALYSADGVRVIELLVLGDKFFVGIATSSLAVAAVVDILIAVILTYLLLRKRNATGYASTAHILQRLTVFAVNAGIWTGAFALLAVILLHVYPSNLIYAVFGFPLCSLYCNTLLANLNARAYIRGETATHNMDVDLFTSMTSRGSDGIKGGKPPRVMSFQSGNFPEGHGGVTFLPMPVVAGRHMPPTSESTCT